MEEKIRKLQRLGGSFYLSLPSSWLSKFNLDKGGEVIISAGESGEIKLFPNKVEVEKEKKAAIEYDKYLFRNLIAEYLFGKDIITIRKSAPFTKNERRYILDCTNNLLNLEIIEEDSHAITIQNLKSELPLKKMIHRMYFITKMMLGDLIEGEWDRDVLNGIIERDKLVSKFYFAIIMHQRELLTKRWDKEFTLVEILDFRLLIERIEQIGDGIKWLAARLLNKKGNVKKDSVKFLLSRYEEAYNAYISHDVKIAKKFWDMEKGDKEKLADKDLVRIYEHIKDIADLVI